MSACRRRIIVIDDHPLCAAAVSAAAATLERGLKIETVGSLRALSGIVRGGDIGLIFLDLRLPDAVGLGGIKTVREAFPGVPVCILTGQGDTATMRQAMALGVAGFLPKTLAFDALATAISELLAGRTAFPVLHGVEEERIAMLSRAETRIMKLLSLGLQNKQIAFELGLSESTVKSHLARIFSKLQVINRSQAILAFDRLAHDGAGNGLMAAGRP